MGTSKIVAVHPTDGDTGRQRREQLLARLEAYDERFAAVETASFIAPEPSDADIPLKFVDTDGEWLGLELAGRQDYEMQLTLGDLLGAVVADPAFDWAVYRAAKPAGPPSTTDVGPVVAIGGEVLERLGRDTLRAAPAYAAFERPDSVALVTALGGSGWSTETVAAFLADPAADATESGTPTVLETVPEIGLDPVALLEAVGDWPRNQVRHLREHTSGETERLTALLDAERPDVCQEAVWAIDQPFSNDVDRVACVEPLVGVARQTADPDLRQSALSAAAKHAAKTDDSDIVEQVISVAESLVLADARPAVRQTAIRTLTGLIKKTWRREEILATLREVYETDDDPKTRAKALHAVANYGTNGAVLFEGLASESPTIRSSAASLLDTLVATTQSSMGTVETVTELRKHGGAVRRALTATDDEVRAAAMKSLRVVDVDVEAALLVTALREDGNEDVRAAAAEALAKVGDEWVLEALVGGLDDVPPVRQAAADSIAIRYAAGVETPPPVEPTEPLLELLADAGDRDLRHTVVRALGAIGGERVVSPLLAAVDEGDISRDNGLKALGEVGEPAVEPLCDRLLQACAESGPVGAYAAGLATAGDERAFDPLLTAYECEGLSSSEYEEIGHALGRIGGTRAVERLMTALRAGRPGAEQGLGAAGSPAVAPLLALLAERDDTEASHERGVLALGRTGDSRAIQRLLYMLADAEPSLACTIIDALGYSSDSRLVPVFRQLSVLALDAELRETAGNAQRRLCRDLEAAELAALGVPTVNR